MTDHPRFTSMTIAQRGLWYLCQSDPSALAAYNMVFPFRADRAIDADLLQRALARVCDRHEALRSAIRVEAGKPVFETLAAGLAPVPLRHAVGKLPQVARQEHAQPFDLRVAPLLRAVLVDTEEGACRGLVLTVSHLVFDGASADLFLRELSHAAQALADGREPPEAAPATSLAAHAPSETAYVDSPAGHEALRAVLRRLEGVPPRLALGRGALHDVASTHRAETVEFTLDNAASGSLAAFARACRVTEASTCLATFQLLLWRFSGQHDFGICLPVANRDAPGARTAIAYLANLAVVRADVRRTRTVGDLVAAVQDQMFDILEASSLPFPLVVQGMKRTGQNLHGPLLQVGFGHERSVDTDMRLGNATLAAVDVAPPVAKNEIKLDIVATPAGMRCRLIYDADVLERGFVERMARSYATLLASLCAAAPATRVGALAYLDPIDAAGTPTKPAPADLRCVHELFEQLATREPEAEAVCLADRVVSRAELNGRANRLAWRLRELGVGPEIVVAVCAERSLELCVGILAVLKAGGAYFPMDPESPPERLVRMLSDVRPLALLAQAHLASRLPASPDLPLIVLERDDPDAPDGDLPPLARLGNLAYGIHTSGSTGEAKAAMNTHEGFANLVRWYFDASASDATRERVLLASAPGFDLTQKNLAGALAAGAVVVVPAGPVADVAAAREVAAAHAPTRMNCAPSACRLYMSEAGLGGLQRLVLGGEPVDARLADAIASAGLELVNSYGPAECADVALAHRRGADELDAMPLGEPLPGVSIHLLDAALEPVPAGVIGELCIGGIGVGRGYLNRPHLTAERFVPDPFGGPGRRMYRTGDLARRREDGALEFVGRADSQVKVRGQRVELGEIEAAIAAMDAVRECAVVARTEADGQTRLRACVTLRRPADGAVRELRGQLANQLPGALVPQEWIVLDELPLNRSGKIDRQALLALAPVREPTAPTAQDATALTPTQRLLAGIWAEVLGVDAVGLDDDFFALGGHSLLAMHVVGRIRRDCAVAAQLRDLFDAPTLAALAALVDARRASGVAPSAAQPPLIARRPRGGSPSLEGL